MSVINNNAPPTNHLLLCDQQSIELFTKHAQENVVVFTVDTFLLKKPDDRWLSVAIMTKSSLPVIEQMIQSETVVITHLMDALHKHVDGGIYIYSCNLAKSQIIRDYFIELDSKYKFNGGIYLSDDITGNEQLGGTTNNWKLDWRVMNGKNEYINDDEQRINTYLKNLSSVKIQLDALGMGSFNLSGLDVAIANLSKEVKPIDDCMETLNNIANLLNPFYDFPEIDFAGFFYNQLSTFDSVAIHLTSEFLIQKYQLFPFAGKLYDECVLMRLTDLFIPESDTSTDQNKQDWFSVAYKKAQQLNADEGTWTTYMMIESDEYAKITTYNKSTNALFTNIKTIVDANNDATQKAVLDIYKNMLLMRSNVLKINLTEYYYKTYYGNYFSYLSQLRGLQIVEVAPSSSSPDVNNVVQVMKLLNSGGRAISTALNFRILHIYNSSYLSNTSRFIKPAIKKTITTGANTINGIKYLNGEFKVGIKMGYNATKQGINITKQTGAAFVKNTNFITQNTGQILYGAMTGDYDYDIKFPPDDAPVIVKQSVPDRPVNTDIELKRQITNFKSQKTKSKLFMQFADDVQLSEFDKRITFGNDINEKSSTRLRSQFAGDVDKISIEFENKSNKLNAKFRAGGFAKPALAAGIVFNIAASAFQTYETVILCENFASSFSSLDTFKTNTFTYCKNIDESIELLINNGYLKRNNPIFKFGEVNSLSGYVKFVYDNAKEILNMKAAILGVTIVSLTITIASLGSATYAAAAAFASLRTAAVVLQTAITSALKTTVSRLAFAELGFNFVALNVNAGIKKAQAQIQKNTTDKLLQINTPDLYFSNIKKVIPETPQYISMGYVYTDIINEILKMSGGNSKENSKNIYILEQYGISFVDSSGCIVEYNHNLREKFYIYSQFKCMISDTRTTTSFYYKVTPSFSSPYGIETYTPPIVSNDMNTLINIWNQIINIETYETRDSIIKYLYGDTITKMFEDCLTCDYRQFYGVWTGEIYSDDIKFNINVCLNIIKGSYPVPTNLESTLDIYPQALQNDFLKAIIGNHSFRGANESFNNKHDELFKNEVNNYINDATKTATENELSTLLSPMIDYIMRTVALCKEGYSKKINDKLVIIEPTPGVITNFWNERTSIVKIRLWLDAACNDSNVTDSTLLFIIEQMYRLDTTKTEYIIALRDFIVNKDRTMSKFNKIVESGSPFANIKNYVCDRMIEYFFNGGVINKNDIYNIMKKKGGMNGAMTYINSPTYANASTLYTTAKSETNVKLIQYAIRKLCEYDESWTDTLCTTTINNRYTDISNLSEIARYAKTSLDAGFTLVTLNDWYSNYFSITYEPISNAEIKFISKKISGFDNKRSTFLQDTTRTYASAILWLNNTISENETIYAIQQMKQWIIQSKLTSVSTNLLGQNDHDLLKSVYEKESIITGSKMAQIAYQFFIYGASEQYLACEWLNCIAENRKGVTDDIILASYYRYSLNSNNDRNKKAFTYLIDTNKSWTNQKWTNQKNWILSLYPERTDVYLDEKIIAANGSASIDYYLSPNSSTKTGLNNELGVRGYTIENTILKIMNPNNTDQNAKDLSFNEALNKHPPFEQMRVLSQLYPNTPIYTYYRDPTYDNAKAWFDYIFKSTEYQRYHLSTNYAYYKYDTGSNEERRLATKQLLLEALKLGTDDAIKHAFDKRNYIMTCDFLDFETGYSDFLSDKNEGYYDNSNWYNKLDNSGFFEFNSSLNSTAFACSPGNEMTKIETGLYYYNANNVYNANRTEITKLELKYAAKIHIDMLFRDLSIVINTNMIKPLCAILYDNPLYSAAWKAYVNNDGYDFYIESERTGNSAYYGRARQLYNDIYKFQNSTFTTPNEKQYAVALETNRIFSSITDIPNAILLNDVRDIVSLRNSLGLSGTMQTLATTSKTFVCDSNRTATTANAWYAAAIAPGSGACDAEIKMAAWHRWNLYPITITKQEAKNYILDKNTYTSTQWLNNKSTDTSANDLIYLSTSETNRIFSSIGDISNAILAIDVSNVVKLRFDAFGGFNSLMRTLATTSKTFVCDSNRTATTANDWYAAAIAPGSGACDAEIKIAAWHRWNLDKTTITKQEAKNYILDKNTYASTQWLNNKSTDTRANDLIYLSTSETFRIFTEITDVSNAILLIDVSNVVKFRFDASGGFNPVMLTLATTSKTFICDASRTSTTANAWYAAAIAPGSGACDAEIRIAAWHRWNLDKTDSNELLKTYFMSYTYPRIASVINRGYDNWLNCSFENIYYDGLILDLLEDNKCRIKDKIPYETQKAANSSSSYVWQNLFSISKTDDDCLTIIQSRLQNATNLAELTLLALLRCDASNNTLNRMAVSAYYSYTYESANNWFLESLNGTDTNEMKLAAKLRWQIRTQTSTAQALVYFNNPTSTNASDWFYATDFYNQTEQKYAAFKMITTTFPYKLYYNTITTADYNTIWGSTTSTARKQFIRNLQVEWSCSKYTADASLAYVNADISNAIYSRFSNSQSNTLNSAANTFKKTDSSPNRISYINALNPINNNNELITFTNYVISKYGTLFITTPSSYPDVSNAIYKRYLTNPSKYISSYNYISSPSLVNAKAWFVETSGNNTERRVAAYALTKQDSTLNYISNYYDNSNITNMDIWLNKKKDGLFMDVIAKVKYGTGATTFYDNPTEATACAWFNADCSNPIAANERYLKDIQNPVYELAKKHLWDSIDSSSNWFNTVIGYYTSVDISGCPIFDSSYNEEIKYTSVLLGGRDKCHSSFLASPSKYTIYNWFDFIVNDDRYSDNERLRALYEYQKLEPTFSRPLLNFLVNPTFANCYDAQFQNNIDDDVRGYCAKKRKQMVPNLLTLGSEDYYNYNINIGSITNKINNYYSNIITCNLIDERKLFLSRETNTKQFIIDNSNNLSDYVWIYHSCYNYSDNTTILKLPFTPNIGELWFQVARNFIKIQSMPQSMPWSTLTMESNQNLYKAAYIRKELNPLDPTAKACWEYFSNPSFTTVSLWLTQCKTQHEQEFCTRFILMTLTYSFPAQWETSPPSPNNKETEIIGFKKSENANMVYSNIGRIYSCVKQGMSMNADTQLKYVFNTLIRNQSSYLYMTDEPYIINKYVKKIKDIECNIFTPDKQYGSLVESNQTLIADATSILTTARTKYTECKTSYDNACNSPLSNAGDCLSFGMNLDNFSSSINELSGNLNKATIWRTGKTDVLYNYSPNVPQSFTLREPLRQVKLNQQRTLNAKGATEAGMVANTKPPPPPPKLESANSMATSANSVSNSVNAITVAVGGFGFGFGGGFGGFGGGCVIN